MRAFAAAVLVLATLAPARAEDVTYAGGAIYFYERGTSTTKVDRVPELKLDLYPLTFDAELVGPEFYLEVAGDWIPGCSSPCCRRACTWIRTTTGRTRPS